MTAGRGARARRWAGSVLVVGLVLTGCGAGQVAQTAVQVTSTGGTEARVGPILVRDLQVVFDPPIPGDTVYRPGEDAPLQMTIVNEGAEADRLVAVSSPIARAGTVSGAARVPGGHALVAGYDEPIASITLDRQHEIDVALVGLTGPIRSGLTYPLTLTFERAGTVSLLLPVEVPSDVLPPRARP